MSWCSFIKRTRTFEYKCHQPGRGRNTIRTLTDLQLKTVPYCMRIRQLNRSGIKYTMDYVFLCFILELIEQVHTVARRTSSNIVTHVQQQQGFRRLVPRRHNCLDMMFYAIEGRPIADDMVSELVEDSFSGFYITISNHDDRRSHFFYICIRKTQYNAC